MHRFKELVLSPFARVRIWNDDLTVPRFAAEGVRTRTVAAGAEVAVVHQEVGLEAWVGRGARSDYGMLALDFVPSDLETLRLEVPFSSVSGPPWRDGLGSEVDEVRVGLPEEYADAVLDALATTASGVFLPGTLRVSRATHGLVGSSPDFFRRLVRAIVSLRLMHVAEEAGPSMVGRLRDVLGVS